MWLIEKSALSKMEKMEASGFHVSAERQSEFMASYNSSDLNTVGSTAVIDIKGVLTNSPSFMAMMFGGGNTVYTDIIAQANAAKKDSSVKNIELRIDSPGGHVEGLFNTIDALNQIGKPIKSVVTGKATSAAYAIASQADTIEASSPASEFGSIGVVISMEIDESVVDITSTNAPNKRPDPSTEEGKAVIVEYLDAIHELFVGAISEGRGVEAEEINKSFGRGGTLLARDALNRGMIDSIQRTALKAVGSTQTRTAAKGEKIKVKAMDLETLKAEHADVYAAAVKEGLEKGVAQERERVEAHLIMGEQSHALDIAVEAITSGDEINSKFYAKYMAAGMARNDLQAAASDSQSVESIAEGSASVSADENGNISAQIFEKIADKLHLDVEA